MSRKVALITLLLALIGAFIFDSSMLVLQSGKLEKMIRSIQHFDSLYSENLRMRRQLATYSEKLNIKPITKEKLKAELDKLLGASIRISGENVTFKGKALIDASKLLNTLAQYTNVAVKNLEIDSLIPVKYTGFSYTSFKEKVILKKLIVSVYGG